MAMVGVDYCGPESENGSAGIVSYSIDASIDEITKCDLTCLPSPRFLEDLNKGAMLWTRRQLDQVVYRDVPVHPVLWQFAAMGSWMLLIVGVLLKVVA